VDEKVMLMDKNTLIVSAICLLFVLAFAGCAPVPPTPGPDTEKTGIDTGSTTMAGGTTANATQELKKFSSWQELRGFLQEQQSQSTSYDAYREFGLLEGAMMADSIAAPSMAGAGSAQKVMVNAVASDYSQTNVQVEGVDEADFVKNDNKYIYVLSGQQLVIIDAYPAQNAKTLSKTEIDGNPRDLFVKGDRLVVFTDLYEEVFGFEDYGYLPQPRSRQQTHALVFDISDRGEPQLIHDYAIPGGYYQSRMIGGQVYLLTQQGISYYDFPGQPRIMDGKTAIIRPDVYYFDNPEDSYQLTTVASFDIASDAKSMRAKSFLMGYTNTLYVSEENIYVSYQKNLPYRYYQEEKEQRFYEAVVPVLPTAIKTKVLAIKDDSSLSKAERWEQTASALEEMYTGLINGDGATLEEKAQSMDQEQQQELQDLAQKIQDSVQEWELKRQQEREKTVIQKIGIDGGNIDYVGRGEVPGQLLNQFSLDENAGKLRVATTSYLYTSKGSTMYNNVYILDSMMKITGELERLAPDERIYSTRFIGERLYMVTFKRIDPLFVIDLAGKDPEVLGKLKIPGFSDYLHPYDATHIIGIGKETEGNEWGGVSVKGVKLALFDVSDVEHPRQIDHVEIGAAGSDSEALSEHKAFLFDKEKNLLVIPIREVKESYDAWQERVAGQIWPSPPIYRQRVWQGAYVFTVTDKGFEERGTVSHFDGEEDGYYYWGSPYAVRRSLFMDDVLYTISNRFVQMNDLDTLKELKSVKLPYSQSYPEPYYAARGGSVGIAVSEPAMVE
jgi:inhibitor of cysteine peptidase